MSEKKHGLELLREPFPAHQVSKLPKGTKAQNDCPNDQKKKCSQCGGFHHPQVIHLDYVGHAALTDRLLDADPEWTWEPLALKDGLPAFDESGGLWIKLTVCGVTRLGYGNAAESSYKDVGSREKEVIGDALRNAAMRFGAALELWHKGDLHITPTAGAKENINQEQILKVDDLAVKVHEWIESGSIANAVAEIEQAGLETEEYVYLWTKFDSKQRSAMKKEHERQKLIRGQA